MSGNGKQFILEDDPNDRWEAAPNSAPGKFVLLSDDDVFGAADPSAKGLSQAQRLFLESKANFDAAKRGSGRFIIEDAPTSRNAFADLIPPQKTEGMFDDLVPRKGGNPADQFNGERPSPIRYMDEPTWIEKQLARIDIPKALDDLRGSSLYSVARGAMSDPLVGAVQFVANAFPGGAGQAVNQRIAEEERQYEAAREARGRDGYDAARVVGKVVSPANFAIAARAPLAATALGRIAQGAAVGGGTAAMDPITEPQNYWAEKGGQVASGAITGAVLTPALGAIGDKAVRMLFRRNAEGLGARSTAEMNSALNEAMRDLGQTIHDIPPAQLEALRAKVGESLSQGRTVDPAALARKADFEAMDIQPTLGQVTRDPLQYAREQNLRGVEGVGEPLMARFQDQAQRLQARVSAPAEGAKDAYNAGVQISGSLKSTDDLMHNHVRKLYEEARASSGKDLDVPLNGLAQDYAQVLSDFADKVPTAIRQKFAALGLDPVNPTNQQRVFTIENADGLLKSINEHIGSDRATNLALGRLRDAVKGAVLETDSSGGPFAPAVRAAAERFRMHDAIPALKAASEGSIAPEDFVRRFIVNGKTDDLKGLANVLKTADPSAWGEVRAQIGNVLRRAAYGENVVGDASFRPNPYIEQVRRLGIDKLSAFFNAEEMDNIMRAGRVGAYIKQAPNASPVSSSNSNIGIMNVLSHVPGVSSAARAAGMAAGTVGRLAGGFKQRAEVNNSLSALLEDGRLPLNAGQENYLRLLLNGGAATGGSLAGDRY